MVLPLADDNTGRKTFPYVNYALIAANVFVFVVFQGMGANEEFTSAFSTVPAEIATGKNIVTPDRRERDPETGQIVIVPGIRATPISVYITLISSMFMHGGIAHILGNMLFLWIFGDNVEDLLGHVSYLVFYLVCGILSSLAQVFSVIGLDGLESQAALVPCLGASGAISGVLGGYLLMFPTRKVLVLLFRVLVWVPAWVAIGIWFGFQIISGIGMLGGNSDGVAYAAHVGGFVAGLALVKLFAAGGSGDEQERARSVRWPAREEEGERY